MGLGGGDFATADRNQQMADFAAAAAAPAPGAPTTATDQPSTTTVSGPDAGNTSTAAVNTGSSISDVFGSAFADLPPGLQGQVTDFANQWTTQNPGANSSAFEVALTSAPFYTQYFSANQQLLAQGKQPLAPSDYLAYMQQAQQLAQAAGLPAGFMSKAETDTLIGNSVSMSELNERVNNAYLAVNEIEQTNPGVSAYLAQNYGIGQGGLLAYVMDPKKALPALEQQMAGAVVGGAATQAGFQPVSVDEAVKVAQAIGGPGSAAGGSSVSSIYQQAVSGMAKIVPDIDATKAAQGPGNVATVSQDQLIGSQFIGDVADTRAVQLAVGQRTAAFRGGGGPVGQGQPGGGTGSGYGSQ